MSKELEGNQPEICIYTEGNNGLRRSFSGQVTSIPTEESQAILRGEAGRNVKGSYFSDGDTRRWYRFSSIGKDKKGFEVYVTGLGPEREDNRLKEEVAKRVVKNRTWKRTINIIIS